MNLILPQKRRPVGLILSAAGMGAALWMIRSRVPAGTSTGLESMGAILLVLGLAFLAPWALRLISNRLHQGAGASDLPIQVRGVRPMGQGRSLLIVEVEGERFLLCSGKERMELVAKLSGIGRNSTSPAQEAEP
jgi:flagellar biogenesis protein FliO